MKKIITLLFTLMLIFSVPSTAEPSKSWKEKMGTFAGLLTELLKDISLQENSQSVERAKKIEKNASLLSEMAHKVNMEKMADADPSLELVSSLFSDEMNRGYQALSAGHAQYAHKIFKSASKYCIACHTRMEKSSLNFGDLSLLTKEMRIFEKAEFLGALQQFKPSFDSYLKIIEDTKHAETLTVEWEKSLKRALTIAIRVNNSPDDALKVISKAEGNKNTPKSYKAIFVEWKKSIALWKSETNDKNTGPIDLFHHAEKLIKAGENKKDYFYDPRSFVDLLRASSYLHKALQVKTDKDNTFKPNSLYYLGFIYETLGDFELWNLHELYYESCIRKFPHTSWSTKCYKHYSDSIIAGYSGSSGTNIPQDVKLKLATLKALSAVKSVKK